LKVLLRTEESRNGTAEHLWSWKDGQKRTRGRVNQPASSPPRTMEKERAGNLVTAKISHRMILPTQRVQKSLRHQNENPRHPQIQTTQRAPRNPRRRNENLHRLKVRIRIRVPTRLPRTLLLYKREVRSFSWAIAAHMTRD
jgi:hypothetical protein